MTESYKELIEFVLEQAADQPVARRIKIYRSLALLCGDESLAPRLSEMALDLEVAEHKCREFVFRLSAPRAAASKSGGAK